MSPFEQASVNMNTYRPTIIIISGIKMPELERNIGNNILKSKNLCAFLLATNNRNLGVWSVDFVQTPTVNMQCVRAQWLISNVLDYLNNPSAPFASMRCTESFRDCCFSWNDFDSFGSIANYIWYQLLYAIMFRHMASRQLFASERHRECYIWMCCKATAGPTTSMPTQARYFFLLLLPISMTATMLDAVNKI